MKKTKQLALDGMLAAMCAALGYLSLDFGNLKITFESLPILIGGLMFGPADGLLVGGTGTLIYQLLRYGVSATTLLWMLPYALCGLFIGWVSKRRNFELRGWELTAGVTVNELMITVLNTAVLYIDSRIYGYYTPALITGALAVRIVICFAKSAAFSAVLPLLLRPLEKTRCKGRA